MAANINVSFPRFQRNYQRQNSEFKLPPRKMYKQHSLDNIRMKQQTKSPRRVARNASRYLLNSMENARVNALKRIEEEKRHLSWQIHRMVSKHDKIRETQTPNKFEQLALMPNESTANTQNPIYLTELKTEQQGFEDEFDYDIPLEDDRKNEGTHISPELALMIEASKSTIGDVGKSIHEIKNMGKVLKEMTSVKRINFSRLEQNEILDKGDWKERKRILQEKLAKDRINKQMIKIQKKKRSREQKMILDKADEGFEGLKYPPRKDSAHSYYDQAEEYNYEI